MHTGTRRLHFAAIACAILLAAGCASREHREERGSEAAAVPAPPPPAPDPQADAHAQAIAKKVAAKAKRSQKAGGKQNRVKDSVQVKKDANGQPIVEQTGEASWYGKRHNGKKTASGARFDQNQATAAHPSLPLGTKAKVTNLDNGKSVDVIINDRGPYTKGRDIDLSKGAAQQIGATDGTAPVKIDAEVKPDPTPSSGPK